MMSWDLGKKIRSFFENKAIVLMYHRVDDVEIDPWQLCVSKKNFEEHLQVLQSYKVIPVGTLVDNLNNRKVPSKGICVTFDDGYKDNYINAKPLLEKYNVPATFFIATGAIDSTKRFWWDELEHLILYSRELPSRIDVNIAGENLEYSLHSIIVSKEEFNKHKIWYWPEEPVTERCKLYLNLWERMKPLANDTIHNVIQQLHVAVGREENAAERFTITENELRSLNNTDLFTIGVHTVNHPALGMHHKQLQQAEISDSKRLLEDYCNKQMTSISYPYGNYNNDTLAVTSANKLAAGFTTEEVVVTDKTKPLEIGRFQVNNWTGEKFEEQINKWFKSYEA